MLGIVEQKTHTLRVCESCKYINHLQLFPGSQNNASVNETVKVALVNITSTSNDNINIDSMPDIASTPFQCNHSSSNRNTYTFSSSTPTDKHFH